MKDLENATGTMVLQGQVSLERPIRTTLKHTRRPKTNGGMAIIKKK